MCKKLFCEIFLSVYLLFAKDISSYQVITYGYCHFDYCRSELHWGFMAGNRQTTVILGISNLFLTFA